MRILGNPKTTLRIATGTSELRMRPLLILAIFGFPLNTPLPTGQALAHRSRSRKGQSPKSAVIRGLLIKSRGKRGSARHFLFRTTFGVRLSTRLERIFCVLLRLSERSGTIEVHLATLSAQNLRKIFRSMLRDYVYLIGSMPTFNNLVAVIYSVLHQLFARSFDEGVTVSRPNAVGRDGVVNLFALCKFCPFLLNADSWQPKN